MYATAKGLSVLDQTWTTARKFGVQILGCISDITALKDMFPKTWQTLINNSGVHTWLEATDQEGSTFVSNMAGETENFIATKNLNYPSEGFTVGAGVGYSADELKVVNVPSAQNLAKLKVSIGYTRQRRALIWPQEVRELGRLGRREQIIFMKGVRPIRCDRVPYYETQDKHKAQPNPYAPRKK